MAERNQVDPGVVPAVVLYSAYGVAIMLAFMPLLELVGSILPLQLGEARWRFGALGMLSADAPMPVFGLFIAIVTASFLRHRTTIRVLSGVALIAAFTLFCAAAIFVLDVLQLRREVRPEVLHTYEINSLKALLKMIVTGLGSLWVGIAGFRAARQIRTAKASAERLSDSSPLVVTSVNRT